MTDLGREQARAFAGSRVRPPGLLLHSIARRAEQTAMQIALESGLTATELDGVHEVQAGDLEDRSDDEAIAEFSSVYRRWCQGSLDVAMPGGETGHDVLQRYLPAITEIRLRYLDDAAWRHDIVVVSHGAAIRLAAAALTGVDANFVMDHHLANTEAVSLVPITDGRWTCVQWGAMTPPFYPEPDVHPVEEAVNAADPMG